MKALKRCKGVDHMQSCGFKLWCTCNVGTESHRMYSKKSKLNEDTENMTLYYNNSTSLSTFVLVKKQGMGCTSKGEVTKAQCEPTVERCAGSSIILPCDFPAVDMRCRHELGHVRLLY